METGTASPLELAWTLPAALGALASVILLWYSVCDERARRRVGVDGVYKLDIQKSIGVAVVLTVSELCLAVIGVNALVTPPNPLMLRDPTTAATAVVNAILLIMVNASLTALAGYLLLQRGAVVREVLESRRRDRRATDRKPQPDGALDTGAAP
jgi:hypothetical protein